MRGIKMIRIMLCTVVALIFLSCDSLMVKEYPEAPATRDVWLTLVHQNLWTFQTQISDRAPSRAVNPDSVMARYVFRYYAKGTRDYCAAEYTVYSDITMADTLRVQIPAPVGDWDLRVWKDLVDRRTKESCYYNADDFGHITIKKPYQGSDMYKEAYVGVIQMNVPETFDLEWVPENSVINLERPQSAYVLVTEDLEKFVRAELARHGPISFRKSSTPADVNAPALVIDGVRIPIRDIDLSRYKIRVRYTGYLPSVFHHFTNRPVDSDVGVYYDSEITILEDTDAMIAFDHIFVNGITSGVNIAVELLDDQGTRLASVGTSTVPLKRGLCTVIRGNFLTSQTGGATSIDPGFAGSFDIKV